MSQPAFRHDHAFKNLFQIRELAQEHIEGYLPPHLVQHLDLASLALDPTNYLGGLGETRSDLVYACRLLSGSPLRFALLHEHKSDQPDRDVRFQIASYKSGIWRADEAQEQPPTFVFPSVVYHGKKDWLKQPFSAAFAGLPPEFLPYLGEHDYWLTNLRALTDEDIRQRSGGKLVGSAFLAFRHAFEPKYFKENFARVFNFDWQSYSRQTWELFLKHLFNYVSSLTGFSRREFEQAAKPLPKQLNHFAMMTMQSIFDEGKLEGKLEGILEGEVKGVLKGKLEEKRRFVIFLLAEHPAWSDDKIANLAGAEKDFVAKIRKELPAKPRSKTRK